MQRDAHGDGEGGGRARCSRDWISRYGLVMGLVLLVGILALTAPGFWSGRNLILIVRQIAINGVLAVGVTVVLLTGGVDLSLGSVVALAGVAAASVAQPGEWSVWGALLWGVLVGGICGLTNGMVVAWGRVPPFVVTLGMMTVARGLALLVSGGRPVSNLAPEFTGLGSGDVLGVPIPVWILGGVGFATALGLRRLRIGRHVYAVGGNEVAAYAAGIEVRRVKLFAYGFCGAMAGLAGVILASRITAGQPNAGMGYELDAIAAVVIGGTSLSGGVGGVGGTLLGALLIGVVNNGLDLLNVSSYYQQIVKGLLIVGAVWLDRLSRRREGPRS